MDRPIAEDKAVLPIYRIWQFVAVQSVHRIWRIAPFLPEARYSLIAFTIVHDLCQRHDGLMTSGQLAHHRFRNLEQYGHEEHDQRVFFLELSYG